MSLTAQTILFSPDYFPLRLDGTNVLFVKMSRASYHQSIFTMPNRVVTDGQQAWSVPLADIVSMVETSSRPAQSARCLFQIAHCGSTLLSRALDFPSKNLVIREPFILRQITAISGVENNEPKQRALKAIWSLLSRPYEVDQPVIIKANVPVNYSIDLLLKTEPQLKGILLHIGFDDYLVAILKSEQRGNWAKHVCRELAVPISATLNLQNLDLAKLTAWQAAALLWGSQINVFRGAHQANQRLLPLEANCLFDNPLNALEMCNAHLDLGVSSAQLNERTDSVLFTSHAKDPTKVYSSQQHAVELAEQKLEFLNELEMAKAWAIEMGFLTKWVH